MPYQRRCESQCPRFRWSLGALHGGSHEPTKRGDLNAKHRIEVCHLRYLPEQLQRQDRNCSEQERDVPAVQPLPQSRDLDACPAHDSQVATVHVLLAIALWRGGRVTLSTFHAWHPCENFTGLVIVRELVQGYCRMQVAQTCAPTAVTVTHRKPPRAVARGTDSGDCRN